MQLGEDRLNASEGRAGVEELLNDLHHLVVIDDGREMDGQRIVIMLDLLTGELERGLEVGWERVT